MNNKEIGMVVVGIMAYTYIVCFNLWLDLNPEMKLLPAEETEDIFNEENAKKFGSKPLKVKE